MTRPASTLTPLGAAVLAALKVRNDGQTAGPRNCAQLARACKVQRAHIAGWFDGSRPIPAKSEAAIRAALPEMEGQFSVPTTGEQCLTAKGMRRLAAQIGATSPPSTPE